MGETRIMQERETSREKERNKACKRIKKRKKKEREKWGIPESRGDKTRWWKK